MFKRLFGVGPSIGEIQDGHYRQAIECLRDALETNSQPEAARMWGEFTRHWDESGRRGSDNYGELQADVTRFVTGNYDPTQESRLNADQSTSLTRTNHGGYYREEVEEERHVSAHVRRRVTRESRW